MQNKCIKDLRVLAAFVFTLRPQYTRVTYAADQPGYFDYLKTQWSQFELHARLKMAQILGSRVYICAEYTQLKDQDGWSGLIGKRHKYSLNNIQ